ncbi:MAG: aspartate carbamoyltransferase regulatory subunit [Clostridia bacterium]|nr:aspartate carbamoyltransferase regulatory subunit [Oscillospiraceae bacterium]MBQ6702411.1 aspartate carbamoyltransferase regulatory subunit [Clostridia bacterium]
MIVGQIKEGIVLDHIKAGRGMKLYDVLKLGELDCSVAVIVNAESEKMGKKDIIKISGLIDIDFNILGFVDPGVTVNIIKDSKVVKREKIALPEKITGLLKCKNPRCITTVEQELQHVFKLCDEDNKVYRCIYCETKADLESIE